MVTISNGILTASFMQKGAEMKVLQKDGKDYIWPGDDKFWNRSAPVLFPICSNLKNKQYTFDGKVYNMPSHGFARDCDFSILNHSENSVSFSISSENYNPDCYPFDYELIITYTLVGKRLDVKYTVNNPADREMYFSIGAHEGYICDGGLSNYEIIFDTEENLQAFELDGTILSGNTYMVGENCRVLPLKDEYFNIDALIFKHLRSRGMYLRNIKTDEKIRIDYKGFDYLLIWSIPGAPFVCVEPWCGITDSADTSGNLREKEGIIRLEAKCSFERTHSIEII